MPDSIKSKVRVVAFPECNGWVAQCVEYDISAQGRDLASVKRNMLAVLTAECKYTLETNGEAFAGIDPAPSHYEALYAESEDAQLNSELDFRIAA